MLNCQKSYYIKALLICSVLGFRSGYTSDVGEVPQTNDFLATLHHRLQGDLNLNTENDNSKNPLMDRICQQILAKVSPTDALIERIKLNIPYIYKINFQALRVGEEINHMGTGFLLDGDKGIIVTNYHVVPGNLAGIITVITDQGEEYSSPFVKILQTSVGYQFGDFTFLQVDELASKNLQAPLSIAKELNVKKHDLLGFMGNSSGSFTVEVGGVNDLYYYWDTPQARGSMSISVALGACGGASGSPVFNKEGEVMGILFAGDNVHNMILPISYVMDAYEQLKAGERITAVSLGVPLISQSIHNLNLYRHLSPTILKDYIASDDQEFKLMVAQPFTSPSTDIIQYNDIVLTVDGKKIGTNQIELNKLLKSSKIHTVEVLRNGELMELKNVPTVTYSQSFVQYIEVNNTIFSSADSSLADRSGLASGTVLVKMPGIEENLQITKVHNTKVTTFNDFIQALFDTVEQKKIATFSLLAKLPWGEAMTHLQMDLRNNQGKSLYVTQMNEVTHQWENIDYKDYVTHLPQQPTI
ncbi:MAG: S1C family serine protease [Candidatus Paracaedibacteraceae bacterium]|nr:S1C family serine protease [Candidatus Paracaedibacteraceae bacterium]